MPDNGDMMLPFLTRKKDIYDGSVTEKNKQLENPFHMPVCRAAFYEVWKIYQSLSESGINYVLSFTFFLHYYI